MVRIVIIITGIIVTLNLEAQNILNHNRTNKIIHLRYGLEPTAVIAGGYTHIFSADKINRQIALFGEINNPTRKIIGISNYEFKTGCIIPAVKVKNWAIMYALNLSTGRVKTQILKSHKFAVVNKLQLGLFQGKWYFSLTGEYEKNIANRITHSEYYLETIYPDVKNGRYKGADGYIQLGIETGFTVKGKIDVNFDFKSPFSEKFNSYNGSPGHINLTIGYRI
ncbi:MAG: hypothetical protein JSV22_07805 [Bacteroidales bacterium]|nr:MAG: hypothetical protein JSV22_07805 [Bacteroidales bacterium]